MNIGWGNPLVTQPESRVKNHPGLKDIFADRLFVHFFRAFRTNFTFFDVIFPFPAKPHAFLLNYWTPKQIKKKTKKSDQSNPRKIVMNNWLFHLFWATVFFPQVLWFPSSASSPGNAPLPLDSYRMQLDVEWLHNKVAIYTVTTCNRPPQK